LSENIQFAYVGTYTTGRSEGIYSFRVHPATGCWEPMGASRGVANPSFLAAHPSRSLLYAVSEVDEARGSSAGELAAYAIHPATGSLTLLNRQSTLGKSPCHVSVHPSGEWAFAANYGDGNWCAFRLAPDGLLEEAARSIQLEAGKSLNPRQNRPCVHQVTPDPAGRRVFVCDFSSDEIVGYEFDGASGRAVRVCSACVPRGSGPRHLTFHSNGKFAYAINEMRGTVSGFHYDSESGQLQPLQTTSALPALAPTENLAADIHVHPAGTFLYGSNRGHDNLAIFAIDQGTGRLMLVGHEPARGKCPRHFAIDSSGQFLYAANQETGNVGAFRIDPVSGHLEFVKNVAEVPEPACIVLVNR